MADLETILFDLYCETDGNAPAWPVIAAWCERFPEHRAAIVDHWTAWVALGALNAARERRGRGS